MIYEIEEYINNYQTKININYLKKRYGFRRQDELKIYRRRNEYKIISCTLNLHVRTFRKINKLY
jgi:hypothetical protein